MHTWLPLLWALSAVAAPDAAAPAFTDDASDEAPPAEVTEALLDQSSQPGVLVVDCRVPAEVLVDGVKLAKLYFPGSIRFDIRPGAHLLRIYTNGDPHDFPIELDGDHPLQALVGRTGISVERLVDDTVDPPDLATIVPVEIRVVGGVGAQVRLGKERHTVGAGDTLRLDLSSGDHAISVRSSDGTVIWATGQLAVRGSSPVLVQVAEGRLPEVSGLGSFMASSGG